MQEKYSKIIDEKHKEILRLKLLYWDDTVIMINTNRATFYGDEKIAYYTAHNKKDNK